MALERLQLLDSYVRTHYQGRLSKGVGRAISHIFESGGRRIGHLGYIFLTVVSCCSRHPSDANNKQRLFETSVTVCLCKQHIHVAQYCGDSDNRIRISKSRRAKE